MSEHGLRALLVPAVEVRLVLTNGRTVHGRVLTMANGRGVFEFFPWGAAGAVEVHVGSIRNASIAACATWKRYRRIASEQRAENEGTDQ